MAKVKKQDLITAIDGSKGFVTQIAKRLNVNRTAVYRMLDRFPDAQEALIDEREAMKDFAEGKMYEGISGGDRTLIIFFLKTQGKDRGYVERQEIAGVADQPIGITTIEVNRAYPHPDDE